jgi:hypothetical protein
LVLWADMAAISASFSWKFVLVRMDLSPPGQMLRMSQSYRAHRTLMIDLMLLWCAAPSLGVLGVTCDCIRLSTLCSLPSSDEDELSARRTVGSISARDERAPRELIFSLSSYLTCLNSANVRLRPVQARAIVWYRVLHSYSISQSART